MIDIKSVATSLTSLTESVREFRQENGRSYHSLSSGKYWLPNDDAENDRLDLQHHAHRLTWDGNLCVSPKKHGAKRVLDLGTGTGIWRWSMLMITLTPSVLPNCSFEVDDLEKEWTWSQKFDFIYSRAMLGCFADLQSIIQMCYDNLEAGGYLEMHDGSFQIKCDDDTLKPDSVLLKISKLAAEASRKLGRPIDLSQSYKEMLEKAGFVDVTFIPYKWPTNQWPKDKKMKTLGLWSLANVDGGWEGLWLALFTRGLGMSKEETMVLCAQGRKELRDQNIHAYWPVYCCYGRKPDTS
ncbi:TAM domain methyltransferase [Pleurostoma richardsiae]|uniref:TAM domain methyltransferase n=1 Tax=Pleurostoma richardsiae TaxID=41990 RepID=A0AA38RET7_9PEZI|nr:TAM domain methyltransferase [Pleurostoma richardsiae]